MSNSSESEYESDSESIPEEINWSLTVIKNRYIILNKLGSGSYCTVWGIYDVENKNIFALKIYNEEDTDDAVNETHVLNKIKHFNVPYSVNYLETFEYDYEEDIYIMQIIELCGYSLHYIMKLFSDDFKQDKYLYSKYITFIFESFISISSSINVLHKNNYAHTDIKPENILIDIPRLESNIILNKIKQSHEKYTILKKKGKIKTIIPSLKNDCKMILENINISEDDIKNYLSEFNFGVKLCDFGTSLIMPDNTIYKKHTSYYKSPKIILKYDLDYTYDFWSIGCTIYELITGSILFDPFDSDIENKFGENEDRNLMYLISCALGIPDKKILNNSKLSDVFFTQDRLCLRGYDKIVNINFIQNMIDNINYINQTDNICIKNMLQLIDYVVKNVNYDMLFQDYFIKDK
jgi:serine/threonine-protein kinase SRPK3